MSVLGRIYDEKRAEVAAARHATPLSDLRAAVRDVEAPRGFKRRLETSSHVPALIAEVKRASPSQGVIRSEFDPEAIARAYEAVGADALSVLTDGPNFGGSAENLRIAKRVTALPCLRKDFLFDPYQVFEARVWGADAALLIVAGLELELLVDLRDEIVGLGMDALVEVHSEAEAEVALSIGCDLIGVNNRDLKTLKTDISTSERVLPLLAGRAFAVSESALASRADIDRVANAGAAAVLIGTSFCAAPNVEAKVREVMQWK